MTGKKALSLIMVIAVGGMMFSGYLSYGELFSGSCGVGGVDCGEKLIAGLPACVYGFFMYTVVFVVAWWGKKSREK